LAKAGNCQTARQRRPIFNANDYHVRQYKNKLQPPTKKEKIRSSDRIWKIEGQINVSVAMVERRNQLKTLQLLCWPFYPCCGCHSFGCHKDDSSAGDRHIEIIDAHATLTL